MIRSKSRIRPVALFAILMLLLCQTASAALAYTAFRALPQVATVNVAETAPCHDAGPAQQERSSDHGCQDHCPAHDASLETGETQIPAAQYLHLTVLALAPLPLSVPVAPPYTYLASPATPPPLILVYCRLLN